MMRSAQRGLTLIEILVAMVLMLLVTLATITLFSINSQSYKTVDASQELNDSARFTFEVIGQALRNAGYQEYMERSTGSAESVASAGTLFPRACTYLTAAATPPLPCPILGYNNATLAVGSIATAGYYGGRTNNGVNTSDVLAVTFYGSGTAANANTVADGSMVDCQGVAQASPRPGTSADLGLSMFWVNTTEGEPNLSCVSRGVAGPTGTRNSQPIVRGLETFQVMYGVDVNGNVETPSTLLPDRWISAADMLDTSVWDNVRAVRIGFVLRGPPGSGQRPAGGSALTTAERTYWPLGRDFTGTSTEAGMTFVAPDDGRLRRAYTATFMLRNGF
jgi:type IV pilus assembly protein PilW